MLRGVCIQLMRDDDAQRGVRDRGENPALPTRRVAAGTRCRRGENTPEEGKEDSELPGEYLTRTATVG